MITAQDLQAESAETRKEVAKAAVEAASGDEKKAVAAAAVDSLSAEQRKDLIASMWPGESKDRRWVYIAGFATAAAIVLGSCLIAWGAQGDENSVANAILVLATGAASAILGGLLGAYVQR